MSFTYPSSTSTPLLVVLGLLMSLLTVGHTPESMAQTSVERTLHIQEGTVYIDGTPVPESELPASLSVDGLELQYQVYGMTEPVLRIQGNTYQLTSNTLKPIDHAAPNQINGSPLGNAPDGADAHLQALRAQEQTLYEYVRREYEMERAVRQRAQRIHQMRPGSQRAAHLDTLRQTVEELFDLKQANRYREIEHLEQQIEQLRERNEERQTHRDAMISYRIQQLVHGLDGIPDEDEGS